MISTTTKNDSVIRAANGLWYVKYQGRLSATAKRTMADAEEHLRKLQQGLVHFKGTETIRGQAHRGLGLKMAQSGRSPRVYASE